MGIRGLPCRLDKAILARLLSLAMVCRILQSFTTTYAQKHPKQYWQQKALATRTKLLAQKLGQGLNLQHAQHIGFCYRAEGPIPQHTYIAAASKIHGPTSRGPSSPFKRGRCQPCTTLSLRQTTWAVTPFPPHPQYCMNMAKPQPAVNVRSNFWVLGNVLYSIYLYVPGMTLDTLQIVPTPLAICSTPQHSPAH